jgi:hypothetical protein
MIKVARHLAITIAITATSSILSGCLSNTGTTPTYSGKRDACSFIYGKQFPYNWEGSDVGACVIKLDPQQVTTMEPDPIGGLFSTPRTTYKTNMVQITTPVGSGTGEFNGNYIVGVITTATGEAEFICADTDVTKEARGVCGLRQ